MKTLMIFVISLLTLTGIALAHEVTTTTTGTQIGNVTAGVTPDSFLYGLDVGIDNIRYLLTFDNTAKSKVGLEIARERLLEVREMVLQNKVNAAQVAQNEHVQTLEKVKLSVEALSKTNSTEELKEEIELEKELEEHEDEVETVNKELKIKIEVKGQITPEQQTLIDSVLSLMQNKTGEVKIKIENKKDDTKVKIKVETGQSEAEIETKENELEEKSGLADLKQERAEEQIADALEELSEIKAKLLEVNATQVNKTAINELVLQAEQRLAQAQNAFNETKFGEAFGQATAAEQLAKNAKKILERTLEEDGKKEIEIEIKKNSTKIKIKIDNEKLKYTLPITNQPEIFADISTKTGLTVDEIQAIAEVEKESEGDLKSSSSSGSSSDSSGSRESGKSGKSSED